MWAKDDKTKKDGEKILANYKKQLAEKLAREQAEAKGAALSESRGSKRSKMNVTSNTVLSSKSKQLEAEQ
jgi:predicted metal-dependent hydrolase